MLHKRLEELVAKFNGTIDKINSGQGTLGQLVVNPQLYDSLTGATREFQSLAKDMRANPKKFLTIRLTAVLMSRKQLVVNADDFGFTPDVNAGIVEAHRDGILTATTLMANGDAFEDAVRLARETPTLDIGCHLVLIGGRSLVTRRSFPATRRNWWRRWRSAGFACTTNWRHRSGGLWTRGCGRRTWIPTSTRTWRRRCWMRWRGWRRSSTCDGCGGPSIFRCMRCAAECRA